MNCKLIQFDVNGDKRGKLISLESLHNIPFEIKRIYYIFDTLPNESRGHHAHMELEQIVIAIDGACQFIIDNGKEKEKILLNRPDVGLYIGPGLWREMNQFSYGCKLMVIASDIYRESDYIRDYHVYRKTVDQ